MRNHTDSKKTSTKKHTEAAPSRSKKTATRSSTSTRKHSGSSKSGRAFDGV